MTARMAPEQRKIAARDDLTPKPRRQKSPERKEAAANRLRAMTPPKNCDDPAYIATLNPDRHLTEKQMLFIKHWASGETILSAAYRSGYADGGTMAYRLARDPAILKIYNREKALYEQASQMTRKKVMDGLMEGIEMAKMVSEPASVISGWREIGKMCGYYEPIKRTINVNISGNVTMKHLERASDADLLKLIKGEIEEVEFKETEDEEGE